MKVVTFIVFVVLWQFVTSAKASEEGTRLFGGRTCSSLEGPNCLFVNGRSPPEHATSPVTDASETLLDRQLDGKVTATSIAKAMRRMLNKLHVKQQKALKREATLVSGAFQLKGEFIQNRNSLQLEAKRWISQPGPNWIMVGLYGGHNRLVPDAALNVKQKGQVLVLTITDPETGEPLKGCSKLLLFRAQKGLTRQNMFEGEWQGRYSCAGSRTQANLTMVTTQKSKTEKRGMVRAVLRFHSQSFPGRETTLAGCKCLEKWSYEGAVYVNGECGMAGSAQPWCFIEDGTCHKNPAGLNWDYCPEATSSNGETGVSQKKKNMFEVVFRFDENGELVQLNNNNNDNNQNNDNNENVNHRPEEQAH